MKLYAVYNGYTGFADVHVLVVADDEQDALMSAEAKFKEEAISLGHKDGYWTGLSAELLNNDVNRVWVSDIRE